MSEKLSINVNIGGRTYPLTIQRNEEENVRKAAKQINDNIRMLEERYAVRDKQDVLAMTALQYSTKVLEGTAETTQDEAVQTQLDELDSFLENYLKS